MKKKAMNYFEIIKTIMLLSPIHKIKPNTHTHNEKMKKKEQMVNIT